MEVDGLSRSTVGRARIESRVIAPSMRLARDGSLAGSKLSDGNLQAVGKHKHVNLPPCQGNPTLQEKRGRPGVGCDMPV